MMKRVFFVMGVALQSTTAFALDPRVQFTDAWIESECQLQHPSYQPAYENCQMVPSQIIRHMDLAYKMRSSCGHPLLYKEIRQIAYKCSRIFSQKAYATAYDVSSCFLDVFTSKYNPAKTHYCADLEVEK